MYIEIAFPAFGGIRTSRVRIPALTGYFPLLAWGTLGKGGLFMLAGLTSQILAADCQALI